MGLIPLSNLGIVVAGTELILIPRDNISLLMSRVSICLVLRQQIGYVFMRYWAAKRPHENAILCSRDNLSQYTLYCEFCYEAQRLVFIMKLLTKG